MSHRIKLDPTLNLVAQELSERAAKLGDIPQKIGQLYFETFYETAELVKQLALDRSFKEDDHHHSSNQGILSLARAILEAGDQDGSFWAGDLNYAITRIIQLVPKDLVQKKKWDREFRYWTYAVTVGALQRTAARMTRWG
jgi:hypothetical protein